MKVKVCSYSRSIETMYGYGLKQWHKVGMEAELEENEVPGDAFNQLKQLVDNSLNNVLPPEEPTGTIVRDIEPKKSLREQLLEGLSECKSLKMLELYSGQAERDEEFKKIYDKKKLELSK